MFLELAVWPETFQHWSLQVVGWALVLVLKWGPPGELTPVTIPWSQNLSQRAAATLGLPRRPSKTAWWTSPRFL